MPGDAGFGVGQVFMFDFEIDFRFSHDKLCLDLPMSMGFLTFVCQIGPVPWVGSHELCGSAARVLSDFEANYGGAFEVDDSATRELEDARLQAANS